MYFTFNSSLPNFNHQFQRVSLKVAYLLSLLKVAFVWKCQGNSLSSLIWRKTVHELRETKHMHFIVSIQLIFLRTHSKSNVLCCVVRPSLPSAVYCRSIWPRSNEPKIKMEIYSKTTESVTRVQFME